jgi:hypothetical protein
MGRLGHTGTSLAFKRELFKGGFGGQVMQCILSAWQAMTLHRSVRHETCITALLGDELNAAFEADGREWFAIPEVQETDPTFGTQLRRNDIRFFPAPHRHRRVFFTAECKRLHVRTKSGFKHLADEYVTEGIQRFVDGEYSKGVPCGGMVGYVMDNDLNAAFRRVRAEIKDRRRELRISTPHADKAPSTALHDWTHSTDTWHRRSDGAFLLHHMLVGVA